MDRDAAPGHGSDTNGSGLRVAYADPPYPGCAHLYEGHPDYAGEVDSREIAVMLLTYDGWCLHTAATTMCAAGDAAGEGAVTSDGFFVCPVHGDIYWQPGASSGDAITVGLVEPVLADAPPRVGAEMLCFCGRRLVAELRPAVVVKR